MVSKSVESPAGESIEIVSNDDWLELTGAGIKSIRPWHGSKPLIVRELWEHGPVTEKEGRATAALFERIEEHYPNTVYELPKAFSITPMMSSPCNDPAFKRLVRGKRCYSIGLQALPQMWYDKLRGDLRVAARAFTATPVNGTPVLAPIEEPPPVVEGTSIEEFERLIMPGYLAPDLPPLGPIEEPSPAIDVEIASQVAMELLTRVVEIISAGSAAEANPELRKLRNELAHGQGLLSQRLEENDKMRKTIRELGDERAALIFERDGLRQRLRKTEANLTAALKGETAGAVTTEVMKRVDRIMREAPKGKGE